MNYRLEKKGIALVITLLVIVILTIAVTAFMQSMSLERRTSSAFLNILKAREAAEAAEQTALSSIVKLKSKPASAIYEKGTASPDSPYLYLASASPSPAPPLVATTRSTIGEALFSTGQTQPTSLQPSASPVPIVTKLTVPDLNAAGSTLSRTVATVSSVTTDINRNGIVGLQNSSGTNLSIPVNWTYLQTTKGKTVSRFAYWCEDESSKLDLRTAGNANGLGNIHKRGQGETLDDISLDALTKLTAGFSTTNVQNILAFRNTVMGKYDLTPANFRYPFSPLPNTPISDDDWKLIQPYVTIYSNHDDRSPDGNKKLNLNALAQSSDRFGAVEAMRAVIKANLPDFGSRYYRYNNHSAATSYSLTAPAPVSVSDDDKQDYLTKVCVNILDFIDSDKLPTVIAGRQSTGDEALLTARPEPTFGGRIPYLTNSASDLPVAIGKESGAYLSEYAEVCRPVTINGLPYTDPGGSSSATIVFRLTHYIELRNLSGKAINVANGDLGIRPFIQLTNRPTWRATATSPASTTTIRPGDVEIRLPNNLVIPANGYAVLTTDTDIPSGQASPPSTVTPYPITREPFKADETTRTPGTWAEADNPAANIHGTTTMIGAVGEDYTARAQRQTNAPNPRWNIIQQTPTGSSYSSATTRMIMGHTKGFLDYWTLMGDAQSIGVGAATSAVGTANITVPTLIPVSPFNNTSPSKYNSGLSNGATSLSPRYNRSDPRSNTEIKFDTFDARMGTQASGGTYSAASSVASLGKTDTAIDSATTNWYQAMPEFTNEARGDLFTLDVPIVSLGQLGSVYDPASVDKTYRPGYRTLRIGQPDSLANNRLFAPNDTNSDNDKIWTGGLGSDEPTDPNYDRNAFRLLDLFRTDSLTSGRLNPNGVLRGASVTLDASGKATINGNTVILDALLDQYTFNSNTSSGSAQGSDLITNTNLAETGGVKNLVTAIMSELGVDKPFLSAGDLSRLQIFTSTSTVASDKLAELTGVTAMHGISDAGREEFFRRTANLLTTNPLSFTIYTVGQAGEFVSDTSDTFRVRATTYVKTIVSLVPVYPTFADNVTGPPTSWNVVIRSKINP